MAFESGFSGYDYDLFVSYAHADDIATDSQGGWVTHFVRQLEPYLRRRGVPETLRIFFDSRATGGNSHLPELLSAVRRSALFLAVGSPSYAVRDWPRQELDAFVENVSDPSRLFMIECLPLSDGDRYPPPLDRHIPVRFWKASGPRQISETTSPNSEEFSTLLNGLAWDIKEKLSKLRFSQGSPQQTSSHAQPEPAWPGARQAVPIDPAARKTILIAQATDDVEDESDQLLRYLNQYGDEIAILPLAGYPQGGEAFTSAFKQDLARADLFVQLLGRRAGRCPPDLPLGYTHFQFETAKAARAEIMQWRHPDLDLKTVTDPVYLSLLTAETVVASGLEAFKSQVLTWARKRKPEPRKAALTLSPTVFINADNKDMNVAKEIERECLKHALTTYLPMAGSSAEANRKDLAENLTDCDVLLFIYGDTTQDWIRTQLRFFGKVKPKRDSDPKLLAICNGPPAPKPDIGMSLPNAHVINCPEGWDMTTIGNLLKSLVQ